jgi:hypothetical protein
VQRFHLDLTDLRRAYLHEALSVAQPFDGWKGFFDGAEQVVVAFFGRFFIAFEAA